MTYWSKELFDFIICFSYHQSIILLYTHVSLSCFPSFIFTVLPYCRIYRTNINVVTTGIQNTCRGELRWMNICPGNTSIQDTTVANYSQLRYLLFSCLFIPNHSVAILKYLADKYNCPDHWYPKDLAKRAKVDEYMSWQHINTRMNCAKVFVYQVCFL